MKRIILILVLVSGCVHLFADRAHAVSLAAGNVTQTYGEGGVRANFSSTGLGICYAGLLGTPVGFYYELRYYLLPLSVSHGSTKIDCPTFGSSMALEALVGAGYVFRLSQRLSLALNAGLHLALPAYFPVDLSFPYLPFTLSVGIGVTPSVYYRLTDHFALFAAVNAAYDFAGLDFSYDLGIPGPTFAGSGFAIGANAGVALML
jgi:hypothetical protein